MEHQEYLDNRNSIVSAGFEQATQPMIVVDQDTSIVLASDGAGVLLGVARGDLVGVKLEQFFLEVPDFSADLKQKKSVGDLPHQWEVRHSQGQLIEVEVDWISYQTNSEADDGQSEEFNGHYLIFLTDTRKRDHLDELRAAKLAKLSLLNQVSEALYGAHLTLDRILQAVLICMTAGQGLRFNRAFLLLVDEERKVLRGEIAIGPSNADEASRIWHDLAGQPGDLFEMMTSYDQSIKQTDVAVNEIVRHMSVPMEDTENILVKAMHDSHALCVYSSMKISGIETIRDWLGCTEFAVAPLTTRRGPLGLIIADNAISGTDITGLDLEFLQMFANQSAGAIENSRLYHELERRLADLHSAHEKQREDQELLLRMERLSVMGETSAVVAHELRNPLVAIGGFARTLMRGLSEDDPNRQFAKIITDEVARLEQIIHDLLDFIRPRKQMRKLVDIDELVAETVGRHLVEMDKLGIKLKYDLQGHSTQASCHPGEIQQILQNFMINAMQVSNPGQYILVKTDVLEGGIKIEILDDGPGFADDISEKLFSPFFSTKPTGSGLGLTICAQIIKAHGGVIGAKNRLEGGAGFHFILPLPKE